MILIYSSNIQYKLNNQITAAELRVIDENGENLGVMAKDDALRLAEEKGVDLIEIAAMANPPVARIISFDKFRYQKEKELKKQKTTQKSGEMKQVRFGARSAKNDLEIKVKQVEKFFRENGKVELMLILKGREKYNKEWAYLKMKEFMEMIPSEFKVIMEPRFAGKGIVTQIAKK